jgi:7,8-dihydro-6-hydroxymethylpterin dimethyltransferase
MSFQPDLWTRCEYDGLPVYLRGDRPDWFVPNFPGDLILQELARNPNAQLDIPARLFLARLPDSLPLPYPGRAALLQTDYLRECWFHLTNRCNQSCRHCLFASSPREKAELPGARVLSLAREAATLGCRVFALTGGEPLVHPDFAGLVTHLLSLANAHVVVLTNGLGLMDYAAALSGWPRDRFHLQISVDGSPQYHDRLRGRGAYQALLQQLQWLRGQNRTFTLAMCVAAGNVADLTAVVELAHHYGAANVHFLWYLVRGRGEAGRSVAPAVIFPHLVQAVARAAELGLTIDNLTALRSQVFSPSGTIHDGPGSGWNSLAIGPDGRVYPSPALVGRPELATDLTGSLAQAWRESPVLERIRQTTAASLASPWRFLLGGGDLDHSYLQSGSFLGRDPYQPLAEQLCLWLIAREASPSGSGEKPGLRLKMGEVLETCGATAGVALTHHNCLLAAAQPGSIDTVKTFYQAAAALDQSDILNPIGYPEEFIAHIPPTWRFRGYGCGSPVLEAGLQPGERVLDLGCGRGIECFIAAPLVGPTGRVYGVDMLEAMLSRARAGAAAVAANLGFDNLAFKSGYLEDLPLEAHSLDVVLSNCVINLSAHKRRTFAEIFRVLRPGGRLVIADVVCDTEPPAALKNDDVLRGECLAGALVQKDLFGLLQESGFTAVYAEKRFPYRQVQGHQFFSLTYRAVKPEAAQTVTVMYRGPAAGLLTTAGELLPAGVPRTLPASYLPPDTGDLLILDEAGAVLNQAWEAPACCPGAQGCCASPSQTAAPPAVSPALACCAPPAALGSLIAPPPAARLTGQAIMSASQGIENISVSLDHHNLFTANPKLETADHQGGCLVCGSPLVYQTRETLAHCYYCQRAQAANALCQAGHFVCDACHSREALTVMEHLLLASQETDLVALLAQCRRHPSLPLHGPEHHSLVPGIILTVFRNLGGQVTAEMLRTAIRRGQSLLGGACAFVGACGAAVGVGTAFSILLGATPVKSRQRHLVQQITLEVLQASTQIPGARCCQRESWLALRQAARLSEPHLPRTLPAAAPLKCRQWRQNRECLGTACPLWPGADS